MTRPLSLLVLAALAGPLASADPPKVQKFCPVMTTDEVTPEDAIAIKYEGMTVLLCCQPCVAKFRRDPASYLDPKLLPALEGKALPKRAIEQMFCPVYRDRKVSPKDPSVQYKGVTVYVFNEVAKARFEKNPEKYANPAVLPQLKKAPK